VSSLYNLFYNASHYCYMSNEAVQANTGSQISI